MWLEVRSSFPEDQNKDSQILHLKIHPSSFASILAMAAFRRSLFNISRSATSGSACSSKSSSGMTASSLVSSSSAIVHL